MSSKESADQLFHFTKKYESIASIMNSRKFMPFFCIEDISFMYEERRNLVFAFPMVCFCDIPLERSYLHRINYGNYGLGLTKEWGIKNNLNIVNYSFKESFKSASYRILVDYYTKKCMDLDDELNHNFKNAFSLLLMSSKPYEGRKFNKSDRTWTNENYRFYNEREWRYLPLVDKLSWSISLEDYSGNYDAFFNAIDAKQSKIQEKYALEFTVDDILYIFLQDKNETDTFLNDISVKYSNAEIRKIKKIIKSPPIDK
jgi:hypothetical protein